MRLFILKKTLIRQFCKEDIIHEEYPFADISLTVLMNHSETFKIYISLQLRKNVAVTREVCPNFDSLP